MPLIFNKPLVLGRKAVFNPDVFTVIGNPEITAEGTASGFSSSNYIEINTDIFPAQAETFELSCKIKTGTLMAVHQAFFGIAQRGNSSALLDVRFANTAAKTIQLVYSEGFNQQRAAEILSELITSDTEYEVGIKTQGNTIKLYINGIMVYSANDFAYIQPGGFRIGTNRAGGDIWQGLINLKKFKITIDGAEVFSGSKLITPEWQNKPFKFDVNTIN